MSFLFTFSLPKLPFRNPFSIGDSDGVASERNRAGGTLTSGEYYRSTGYHAGSSRRRRHLEDEQPHHEQRPVGRDGEISNEAGYPVSRKRKAMMSSFDDGRGNEYDTVRTLSHRRGREGAFIEDERETYYTTIAHDEDRKYNDDYHYSRPPPRRNEDFGVREEGRQVKRRKMGLAESLISTAISVVIVSTAVGYTAYRMWRDGAFSSTPKPIQAGGDDRKAEEEEDGGRMPMYGTNRSIRSTATTATATLSPPPPYQEDIINEEEEDEEIDTWIRGMESTIGKRSGGGLGEVIHERQNRPFHPPSLSLASPVSPRYRGSGGGGISSSLPGHYGIGANPHAQYGHRRRVKGVGRLSNVRYGKTTATSPRRGDIGAAAAAGAGAMVTSPVRRYLREEAIGSSSSPSSLTKKKQKQEEEVEVEAEADEEEMLFDAQMTWMSDRLKGLIEDGQRALRRPIVLREEKENQSGLSEMEEETGWVSER
ncbi:hypothetical protein FRC18_011272 [Serendipita sp. 400]|nr:hypothetical protein FRC18_011272 [Serendipita sp. 400]